MIQSFYDGIASSRHVMLKYHTVCRLLALDFFFVFIFKNIQLINFYSIRTYILIWVWQITEDSQTTEESVQHYFRNEAHPLVNKKK